MPQGSDLASQVEIKVGGSVIQQPVSSKLAAVVIDQHTHMPGMFTIRLNDPGLELLDGGPFDLTKEVEISAESTDGKSNPLIKGEITALEPQFNEGMIAELVVRGYDKSHRLYRETRSKAYVNTKDSDIATQIAQAAKLQAQVDTTSTVYEHIYQHNQSDLAFLMERAWRIGFECFVEDGKLFFRKPPTQKSTNLSLTWGGDLRSFAPRMTLAEQVNEVVLRSWDPAKKEPIVGKASTGKLYAGIQEQRDGATWAGGFGTGRLVVVNQPAVSQAEADLMAAARLDEISGSFVDAEGLALRRPDLRAGKMVKLEGLGKRFSGTYLITSATHIVTPEGLRTIFVVRGTRTGLLAEELTRQQPIQRWTGVVTALVTNVDDPKKWGRVKVKFPWLSEDVESNWARVVSAGAGNEAGLYAIPAVGDEVAVAFEHGVFNYPYVLGGLWNGQNPIPKEVSNVRSGEQPKVRSWHSIDGHYIFISDVDKKIEIQTASGMQVLLDDQNKKIILKDQQTQVTLEQNKIQVETTGEIKLKGMSIKIEADTTIDIKGQAQVNINGGMINLNS